MSFSRAPKADKNFGQHFLVNTGVVDRIVHSVLSLAGSTSASVIEVGPGQGALTAPLLAKGLRLTVLEFDPRMVEHLKARFAKEVEAQRLLIIEADAAHFDWKKWESESDVGNCTRVICGNLPYNVGTQILFHALENSTRLDAFCFMLQKEVVQRLMAEEGGKDYGAPSISVGLLCERHDSFWVSPGSFSPPPKVQSGVVSFSRRADVDVRLDPRVQGSDYKLFVGAIRRAFQNRRKMLRKSFPLLETTEWGSLRAEQLSPQDWWSLWQKNLLR